jgi:hypothetical protein
MSTSSLDVLIICQNGWWSAICPQLEISGFGETEEEAKLAFERSFTSTMLSKLRDSFSDLVLVAGGADKEPELPELGMSTRGQIKKRATMRFGEAKAAA